MNVVAHIRLKFAVASLLSLTAAGASAQCGGVRPTFEWHTENGLMYFSDITDHGFQWTDSITWNSISGIQAQGTSIVHLYPIAGIDTVTMSVWRNSCAVAVKAVVPHGGQSDQCLFPVFSSFSWGSNGNNAMAFYDASSTGGQQVVEFWDFGDGVIDLSQNPSHFYLFPGGYNVSHSISTVDSSTLCMAGRGERIFVDGNTSTCDTSLFLSVSINSFGGPSYFDASIVVFNDSLEITNSVWDFGDGQVDLTSGANTSHFYNDPGEYQACITVNAFNLQTQQSCVATACETVQMAAVGMQDTEMTAPMRTWPMPFGPELNVEGPSVIDGAQWTLFDVLGQKVLQGRVVGASSLHINTPPLRSGPYMLMVRSETRSSSVLIVHE
jgi:hypothetical protein